MKTFKLSLLAAGLALMAGASHAESGLTPPVEIRDSADPWALEIDADRAHFWQLLVTRVVRDHAHELGRVQQQLSFERAVPDVEGRAKLALPIDRDALTSVPDGVYVQRIVIDAIPQSASERIYRTQRALYFRVTGGAVERIGMREYSDIAEPTHVERDASGGEQRANDGAAVLDAQARVEETNQLNAPLESADRLASEAGTAAALTASEAERD